MFIIVHRNLNILAISVDVGSVQSTTQPIIYTIGIVRDPVIQYTNGEALVPYYRIKYDNVNDLVSISGFDIILFVQHSPFRLALFCRISAIPSLQPRISTWNSRQREEQSQGTIRIFLQYRHDKRSVHLISRCLSLIQMMHWIPATWKPFPAISDYSEAEGTSKLAVLFSTIIWSWFESNRINAPDVIYAAMPAYIYLWPDFLRLLLEPLLEYQASPSYTNAYAAQDIGTSAWEFLDNLEKLNNYHRRFLSECDRWLCCS